jgi:hypothetical protein
MWEDIPLYGCKNIPQWQKGLGFQASVFLTSTNLTKAHTGWKEPQRDHINSFNVHKEINSL